MPCKENRYQCFLPGMCQARPGAQACVELVPKEDGAGPHADKAGGGRTHHRPGLPQQHDAV